MADLLVYEADGNGGDLLEQGNDLAGITGLENQPYLACCGGAEDGSSWWADDLLHKGRDSVHMKSVTMQTLNNVALTSGGRVQIEDAVKKDLAYLQQMLSGTKVEVSVTIDGVDRLRIDININGQQFTMRWLADRQQVYQPQIRGTGIGYMIIEYDFVVA